MKLNNKKSGTSFEYDFIHCLSREGFWAHKFQDNVNGQPFDVIAARNNRTFIFDCKDCKNDIFPLSRIEENQYNAMMLWMECGNSEGLFAIRCSKGIRIIQLSVLIFLKAKGVKVVNRNDLLWFSKSLKEWLEGVSNSEGNNQQ
jgi:Holliday junction resolvase